MKNKRKEIEAERDQRFLEEFGMTYQEFDQLDLHTQLELISQKREEKKKESLGKRLIHKIKKH
jgi:hypothetical protein